MAKNRYYKGQGDVAWLPKDLVDRGYYVIKEPVMTFLKKDDRTLRSWWTGTLDPRTVRAVCMNLAMKELAS
jgi:hypothetical protein